VGQRACSRFIRARKRAAYRGLIGQIGFLKTRLNLRVVSLSSRNREAKADAPLGEDPACRPFRGAA
jgi:hypothetical protein